MTVIGLTGTYGSGKTTAAKIFKSYGAIIIDADKIAKEVVEPGTKALEEIVKEFGKKILLPGGSLDRRKMRSIVFSDEEKLQRLNRIIHPRVRQKELDLLNEYKQHPLVVLNVPLLFERNMESLVDKTLVVAISDEIRIERLKKRDNVSPESIKKVLRAQWPQSKKAKRADFVVNNDGSIEQLKKQIVDIINKVAPSLLK